MPILKNRLKHFYEIFTTNISISHISKKKNMLYLIENCIERNRINNNYFGKKSFYAGGES